MHDEDILKFAREHVEPLPAVGPNSERYRVAATLKDGTHLPCVVVEGASKRVELVLRRFDETRASSHPMMGYQAIVESFVTHGNSVSPYDIKELSESPFAIPLPRMSEIRGETSMSWTQFTAIMADGKEFRFGTAFSREFFEMPRAIPLGRFERSCRRCAEKEKSKEPTGRNLFSRAMSWAFR